MVKRWFRALLAVLHYILDWHSWHERDIYYYEPELEHYYKMYKCNLVKKRNDEKL